MTGHMYNLEAKFVLFQGKNKRKAAEEEFKLSKLCFILQLYEARAGMFTKNVTNHLFSALTGRKDQKTLSKYKKKKLGELRGNKKKQISDTRPTHVLATNLFTASKNNKVGAYVQTK